MSAERAGTILARARSRGGGVGMETRDRLITATSAAILPLGLDGHPLHDRQEQIRAVLEQRDASGLPRRAIDPPPARRRLSPEQLRERLDRTLRAGGRADDEPAGRVTDQQVDLLRFLYFEGGVTVVRDGVEVLRCDRMWVSPLDDRIVVENAEIRYLTPDAATRSILVVRGPRMVKQGGRWTGRDVTLTTCTAADPTPMLPGGCPKTQTAQPVSGLSDSTSTT